MQCRPLILLWLACCVAGQSHTASGQQLSPPWWVAYDMFLAALQQDRCLNISNLEPSVHSTEYAFNITVCATASEHKLVALATFLTVRFDFGGTKFAARVLDSHGHTVHPVHVHDGKHARKLLEAGLCGNPYFVRTAVSQPLPCMTVDWAIFQPMVVQLWIDNLADLWGNLNLLAADLLERVLGLEEFGVRAATLKFGTISAAPENAGSGCEQHPLQRQQQQQQQQQPPQQGIAPAQPVEAAVGRVRTDASRLRLPGLQAALPTGGRRRLPAAGGGWQAGNVWQCWALHLARTVGGERAARAVQRWVL